jgi:hypothetical protein
VVVSHGVVIGVSIVNLECVRGVGERRRRVVSIAVEIVLDFVIIVSVENS